MEIKETIELNQQDYNKVCGSLDCNLTELENVTECAVKPSPEGLIITGDEESAAFCKKLVNLLLKLYRRGEDINILQIRRVSAMLKERDEDEIADVFSDVVAITAKGKKITPKTFAQRAYCRAIKKNSVVIAIGPAGTGKTYLAVAMACNAFKNNEVDKIILTRPAVEAGEKLGFLPGDLQMKVDPYLRPLYDALEEMFGCEKYTELIERGIIEVAPLAYMRGRTLSRSFIILDEAQNTTEEQMKMFLTRFGEGSKVVVNGDITQVDLDVRGRSGLKHAYDILGGIDGIGTLMLGRHDVVRHELVQKIVEAYDGDN